MAKGAITVKIDGKYDDKDLNRAIKDLQALKTQSGATRTGMDRLGVSSDKLGYSMQKMAGMALGAVAAGALLGTFTDFLKDSMGAAIEDEKSVVALSKAMDNLGLSSQTTGFNSAW